MEENNFLMVLENKKIGRSMSFFRKLRDKKAFEVAQYVGISESAYTKYERGESKITIELVQKVAGFLNIDPLLLISAEPDSFCETIQRSFFNTGFRQICNVCRQRDQVMMKLVEKIFEFQEKENSRR